MRSEAPCSSTTRLPYRFLPDERGNLAAGGRLQMLGIKGRGRDGFDTRTGQRVGKPLPVTWVDIDEPDPANAAADPLAVFKQGEAGGGATFARLEGAWYGDGSVFFNSTSGGDAGLGQVWEYRPRGSFGRPAHPGLRVDRPRAARER